MIFKIKSYSTDKICDLYLRRLYVLEKKKKMEFLNKILDQERIYYNQNIIDNVVAKLFENGYILQTNGLSLFSYGKREPIKRKITNSAPLTGDSGSDIIKNLEGAVNLYELTDKGRNFIINDQVLDEKSKEIRMAKFEKWMDRFFGFVTGIATTLVTTWLINKMIK